MKQVFLIFLGGGLGSALRYLIATKLNPVFHNFFLGTFTVNIVGCILIGYLSGIAVKENVLSQNQLIFLISGFCGGFTTFSTFALEKHQLLKGETLFPFLVYLFSSIVIGILGIALGLHLSK